MAVATRCKIFGCIDEDDASCSDVSFLESLPGDIEALLGKDADQAKLRVLRNTQVKIVKVVRPHKVEALRKVIKPTAKVQTSGSFSPRKIPSGGPSSPRRIPSGGPSSPKQIQARVLASSGSGVSIISSPSNYFTPIPIVASSVEAKVVHPSESFDSLPKSSCVSTPLSVTPLHSARVRVPTSSGPGDAVGSGALSPPMSLLSSPPLSARVTLPAQRSQGIPGLSLHSIRQSSLREAQRSAQQNSPMGSWRDVHSNAQQSSPQSRPRDTPRSPMSSLRDVQSNAPQSSPQSRPRDTPRSTQPSSPLASLRDAQRSDQQSSPQSSAHLRARSPSSFLALEAVDFSNSFVPSSSRANQLSSSSSMQAGVAAEHEEAEDDLVELDGPPVHVDMSIFGDLPQDEILRSSDVLRSASGTTTPATLPPNCFTPATLPPNGPMSPAWPFQGTGLGAASGSFSFSPVVSAGLYAPSKAESNSWWRRLPNQDGVKAVSVNMHRANVVSSQTNMGPFKPMVTSFRPPETPVPSTTASFPSSRPVTPSRSSSGSAMVRLMSAPPPSRTSLTRLPPEGIGSVSSVNSVTRSHRVESLGSASTVTSVTRSPRGDRFSAVTRSLSPPVVRPAATFATSPSLQSLHTSSAPQGVSLSCTSSVATSPTPPNLAAVDIKRVQSAPFLSVSQPSGPAATSALNARSPPVGMPRSPRTPRASQSGASAGWFYTNGQQQIGSHSPTRVGSPRRLPSSSVSSSSGKRLSTRMNSPHVGGYGEHVVNRMKSMIVVKCAPPGSMPS